MGCCGQAAPEEGAEAQLRWRVDFADVPANEAYHGEHTNAIRTTKYTYLNFIPKNLYEQFHRLANIFFLATAIIALIPATQALSPETAAVPLSVVLLVTAIRDWVEDRKRGKMDIVVNNRDAHVFRKDVSDFVTVPWTDVRIGDILRIDSDEFIPCDVLMLASSNEDGVCHIETAQLDGETNLKVREAFKATHAACDGVKDVPGIKGHLVTVDPDSNLFKFDGNVYLDGNGDDAEPFMLQNVLLRGCTVRNTDWAIGVAIYTGHQTKIMQNTKHERLKRTPIDRMMNIQILGVFIILTAMCTGLATYSSQFQSANESEAWYLMLEDNPTTAGIISFFAYILLLHSMVPLSAYVSVELVKLVLAMLVGWDLEMYDEETDTPAQARTSVLCDELGMVRYLLSDKTGTLTQNLMTFNAASVNGVMYGAADCKDPDIGGNLLQHVKENVETDTTTHHFMLTLALCHTVIPVRNDGLDIREHGPSDYHAQSPDEAALVKAAKEHGYVFWHKSNDNVLTVNVLGRLLRFEVLEQIEFTSERKRMTTIVKALDSEYGHSGEVIVLSKGADDVMLARLHSSVSTSLVEKTRTDLSTFASKGMRTLVFASRTTTDEKYKDWKRRWHEAVVGDLSSKEHKTNALAEEMESNYQLLGASSVEDKLQEECAETIAALKNGANIAVWVLTGDKQETAVSIAYSCNLLSSEQAVLFVNDHSGSKEGMQTLLQTRASEVGLHLNEEVEVLQGGSSYFSNPQKSTSKQIRPFAMVIDGLTLTTVLGDDDLKERFICLAQYSRAVVCCRCAPIQKGMVVELVRTKLKSICMAIGDGANDVTMIKEADIGVGISGREGMQAVLASDYSIAKFKFLRRLLLVHGRYSYNRIAWVVLYFFLKNHAYQVVQFWYAWFCAASGQTYYEQRFVMLFNIIFTSIPGLVVGITEQDVSPKYALMFPQLYRDSQRGAGFSHGLFWAWLIESWYMALVCFGVALLADDTTDMEGRTWGLWSTGTISFVAVVVVVNLRLLVSSEHWNKYVVHSVVWSIVALVAHMLIYNSLVIDFGAHDFSAYWIIFIVGATPKFYFAVLASLVLALAPYLFGRSIFTVYFPTAAQVIREKELLGETNITEPSKAAGVQEMEAGGSKFQTTTF